MSMNPRKSKPNMAIQIRQAVRSFQKMNRADRFQILVRAGLISQEEADKAKDKAESEAANLNHV